MTESIVDPHVIEALVKGQEEDGSLQENLENRVTFKLTHHLFEVKSHKYWELSQHDDVPIILEIP